MPNPCKPLAGDLLTRIADALERLAPLPAVTIDWTASPAYVWEGAQGRPLDRIVAPPLSLLSGIEPQKQRVTTNVARFAAGHAAHDMLLWGARGMGKSALLRSSVADAQATTANALALVQVTQQALSSMAALFNALGRVDRRFLVYIDDLGFEETDTAGPRLLRSWLEGGVDARPANIRLGVTANRRAIVARDAGEQGDPLNPRDAIDDRLALADRFGLSIGFHACSQDDYLMIIGSYASELGLAWDQADALEWSRRRGGRSGRVAWQYVTELAGRAGRAL